MSETRSLTRTEQQALLAMARHAIEEATFARIHHEPMAAPPALQRNAGAFVTLHKHDQLRGCVGTFDTSRPLAETVREMAVAAATRDTRFKPVTAQEVDELELSISVLEPPHGVQSLGEIEVGRHGLIVSRGFRRGVLLGKVAVERGWNRDEFLAQTCIKAGLSPQDAGTFGRPGGIEVMVFEASDFGEEDLQ